MQQAATACRIASADKPVVGIAAADIAAAVDMQAADTVAVVDKRAAGIAAVVAAGKAVAVARE